MRTVVIIGASGFVGQHLLAQLLKEDVIIYAVQHKTAIPVHQRIRPIKGGIRSLDATLLRKIRPEILFHCARPRLTRFRKWGRRLAAIQAYRLNKNLVRKLTASDIQVKLVFASGSLSYGNNHEPVDEQTPLHPISYSRDYMTGEMPIIAAQETDKLKILVLKLPWMIGNGSWFTWFYKKNVDEKGLIPLFGNGLNMMSLIDMTDAARLILIYAEQINTSGVYHIFSRYQISQKTFALLVQQVLGGELVDYRQLYPRLEKAALEAFESNIQLTTNYTDILDHFPFTPLEETLKRLC